MTPPLSDEELERLEKTCKGTWSAFAYADVQDGILSALAELRHHRSRGLSAEDVEALRWAADLVRHFIGLRDQFGGNQPLADHAVLLLERLCAAKEGV